MTKYSKVVLLVIDALRFDFTIPVSGSGEYYHNQFPILHEMAQTDHGLLLKFMADPPTTTLQRLKGLTTGSLPTFIDAGSNFNSDAIDEDNWLLQLHRQNKSIAFMGDDTWTALFTEYINPQLCYPYESLNVWDLHTVDNGVIEHLFPLLAQENATQWDFLIGHFLGVDHAGHRYGPNHYAMREKLQQMNDVISDAISQIDDDTLLIVFGDHGMDSTGNHGGDSKDELEAALFMYSKQQKFNKKSNSSYDISNQGNNYRMVNQIDLVSTISLLLGLPIPHNNLGTPIDELFTTENGELTQAFVKTLNQLQTFKSSNPSLLDNLDVKYNALISHIELENVEDFEKAYKGYQVTFLEECKSLWAKFDMGLISTGIGIMFLSLLFIITYSRSIPSIRVLTMSFEFIGSVIAMSLVGIVLSFSVFIVLRPDGFNVKKCLATGFALGIIIGFWAPIMDRFSLDWLVHLVIDFFVYNFNTFSFLGIVFSILHCLVFASNSFVVWEDKMILYFITTFGICCLIHCLLDRRISTTQRVLGSLHALTFLILSRLASNINLCREEQRPYCTPTFTTNWWSIILLHLMSYLLPSTIKYFYKLSNSYHSAGPLWIGIGLKFLMTFNASYWTIEYIENNQESFGINKIVWLNRILFESGLSKSMKLAIARLVLFVSLILANFSWSRGPLCVKLDFKQQSPSYVEETTVIKHHIAKNESPEDEIVVIEEIEEEDEEDEEQEQEQEENSIKRKEVEVDALAPSEVEQLVKEVEEEEENSPEESSVPVPSTVNAILGYENVYGASYFLLVLNFAAGILLVTKPIGAISLCMLLIQILSLLELFDILQLKRNLISPIVLCLLGYQHFFSTGHQATIPSIQWELGFMTTETITFPFTHLNILLNTFGSFIIVCLVVPLITLWNIPPTNRPITALAYVITNITTMMTYHTLTSISSLIFAAYFRRHLMVWKIFAPRFMMSGLLLIVVDIVLILFTLWFGTGRTMLQVNNIFG
ncbi:mannose-ethanolamine phosphotransferase gpi13 [Scheffersomyces spartinae]|uniref:Mannose-ethanolamine phosphotransferase gpi13 n=1 Tax=Scheffersomyces spartinae TaxID=45513 RepID=A0A9P7VC41_9ASCO|nr:mannose-ethanolamine phosphotransferase gpi13 [Scheffersomyces spartinae]KAG7194995.1 mannose-ethanolamine phosphotransferase gpi13 [Scheffersomyces spartinae]